MKEVYMATWANMSRTVQRDAEKSDRNTLHFKKSVSKEMNSRVVEAAAKAAAAAAVHKQFDSIVKTNIFVGTSDVNVMNTI